MEESERHREILEAVSGYRDRLVPLRERVLADAVMIGEIPAQTFEEEAVVRFLCDRFTEEDLDRIATDEVLNATGVLQGTEGRLNILVAAHVDSIWHRSIDHTITVTADSLIGPGIADNALGAACLTTLPSLLEALGIRLRANLVFLGASRSLGRGDLGGLRFFTENTRFPVGAAVCIEGVQLGRLSYSSLGMNRCEIRVRTPENRDWQSWSLSGAITVLNRVVEGLLAIETPEVPRTAIILGSINAGNSFNVPPTQATLRFEVRSEEPGMVTRIRERILEIIEEVNAEHQTEAELEIIAQRRPGSIGFTHPFVRTTRAIMRELDIEPMIAPSTSELSVLLEKGIPSLTLGITEGDAKHQMNESVRIAPIFSGLAQLIAVLQTIDHELHDEQD